MSGNCILQRRPVNSDRALSLQAAYNGLTELEARGLRVNGGKCRIWGPGSNIAGDNGCSGISVQPWAPGGGLTVLGTPVDYPGSHALLGDAWRKAVGAIQEATNVVTSLLDPQCDHHVLRFCLYGCRVNHLLRSTNAYAVLPLV